LAKLRLNKDEKPKEKKPVAKAPASIEKPALHSNSEVNERIGFLLQCPPGLANVLKKELNFVGATARDPKMFVKLQRNHDLIFLNHVKSDERLSELRTAEMVLRCPAYGRFKISQRQLGLMADELSAIGPRRLVVTVAGKVFQRQDLARFLTKAMAERGYAFDDDIEDEVWMFCVDESWYFGLPLFKARSMEHRNDRTDEREGSLPPPIAAAIAFAAMPRDEDVVLDPTCGSGTLLAEFNSFAPKAYLIGRDIDKNAVSVALKNLARVEHVDIQAGDSRDLGDLGSLLTLTIANLPFGVQFGEKSSNQALYAGILKECLRLKDENWRGLFLTSDTDAFEKAVREISDLTSPEVMFKAKVRGELATCYRVKPK
jgi:predicted RNA methylase